jgi:hypothetical protein
LKCRLKWLRSKIRIVAAVAHRPAGQQQPLGVLDPQLDLVGVRRHAKARMEDPGQVVRAQPADL